MNLFKMKLVVVMVLFIVNMGVGVAMASRAPSIISSVEPSNSNNEPPRQIRLGTMNSDSKTGTVVAGHMYIPKNTEIECELITPLDSSKNKVGDKVSFKVVNPLVVNNIKMVAAGSLGEATVSQVEHAGGFGAAGSITVAAKSIKTINDVVVPVKFEEKNNGNGRGGWAIAGFAIVSIFSVFINGDEVQLPAGTKFNIMVTQDTDLGGDAEYINTWLAENESNKNNGASQNQYFSKSNAPEVMTIEQAAKYLQINVANMAQLIAKDKVKTIQIGEEIRLRKVNLDEYIASL